MLILPVYLFYFILFACFAGAYDPYHFGSDTWSKSHKLRM